MAHTIRCGRAKHDRCTCECEGAHHGEEATELDRSDPEPLPPFPLPPEEDDAALPAPILDAKPLIYEEAGRPKQGTFTFVV